MDSQDNAHGSQGRTHLGDSINAATRTLHAKLNKAILQHFPLALPPHATTPFIYATGLLHIAPIYLTFESLWQNLIDTPGNVSPNSEIKPSPLATPFSQPEDCANPRSSTSRSPPPCEPRILALLQALHQPLLSRTTPLLSDISRITDQHNPTAATIPIILPTETAAPSSQQQTSRQLNGHSQQSSAQENPHPNTQQAQPPRHTTTTTNQNPNPNTNPHTPHQTALLARIHHSVRARPHVLLAYAWVFYMALFSGGRVLRGMLEGAGEGFWEGVAMRGDGDGDGDGDVDSEDGGGGGGGGEGDGAEGDGAEGSDGVGGSAEGAGVVESKPGSESRGRNLPLGFFRFDTPRDGEDLKVEFKKRFGEAGRALTDQERGEVVAEAGEIFEDMVLLVAELDCMLGKDKSLGRPRIGKWRGKMAVADGGVTSRTGQKGIEPAPGFRTWYLAAGALLAGVGLWTRYAGK